MSNLALVRWIRENSRYDGVEQKINTKYILNDNPKYNERITIKWGRQIWKAVYLQSDTNPVQRHSRRRARTTTGDVKEVSKKTKKTPSKVPEKDLSATKTKKEEVSKKTKKTPSKVPEKDLSATKTKKEVGCRTGDSSQVITIASPSKETRRTPRKSATPKKVKNIFDFPDSPTLFKPNVSDSSDDPGTPNSPKTEIDIDVLPHLHVPISQSTVQNADTTDNSGKPESTNLDINFVPPSFRNTEEFNFTLNNQPTSTCDSQVTFDQENQEVQHPSAFKLITKKQLQFGKNNIDPQDGCYTGANSESNYLSLLENNYTGRRVSPRKQSLFNCQLPPVPENNSFYHTGRRISPRKEAPFTCQLSPVEENNAFYHTERRISPRKEAPFKCQLSPVAENNSFYHTGRRISPRKEAPFKCQLSPVAENNSFYHTGRRISPRKEAPFTCQLLPVEENNSFYHTGRRTSPRKEAPFPCQLSPVAENNSFYHTGRRTSPRKEAPFTCQLSPVAEKNSFNFTGSPRQPSPFNYQLQTVEETTPSRRTSPRKPKTDSPSEQLSDDDLGYIQSVTLEPEKEDIIETVVSTTYWNERYPEKGGPLLTRKLVLALIGPDKLKECTLMGRGSQQIDATVLLRIKGVIKNVYGRRRRGKYEFEALWSKCVTSVGHMCKNMRTKAQNKSAESEKNKTSYLSEWYCSICLEKPVDALWLEFQLIEGVKVFLRDKNSEIWLYCRGCRYRFHLKCVENLPKTVTEANLPNGDYFCGEKCGMFMIGAYDSD